MDYYLFDLFFVSTRTLRHDVTRRRQNTTFLNRLTVNRVSAVFQPCLNVSTNGAGGRSPERNNRRNTGKRFSPCSGVKFAVSSPVSQLFACQLVWLRRYHGDAPRERQRGPGSAAAEAGQELGVPAAGSTRDPEQEHRHRAGGIWAVRGESVCLGFLTASFHL